MGVLCGAGVPQGLTLLDLGSHGVADVVWREEPRSVPVPPQHH